MTSCSSRVCMPAAVSALPFAKNNGTVDVTVFDGRSGVRAPSRRLVNSSTSLRLARRRLWPQALVLHAARYHRAAGDDHGTARRLARAPASVAASAAGAPSPAYQDQQGGVVGGPTGQGVAEGGWGDSSSQRQAGRRRSAVWRFAFRCSEPAGLDVCGKVQADGPLAPFLYMHKRRNAA